MPSPGLARTWSDTRRQPKTAFGQLSSRPCRAVRGFEWFPVGDGCTRAGYRSSNTMPNTGSPSRYISPRNELLCIRTFRSRAVESNTMQASSIAGRRTARRRPKFAKLSYGDRKRPVSASAYTGSSAFAGVTFRPGRVARLEPRPFAESHRGRPVNRPHRPVRRLELLKHTRLQVRRHRRRRRARSGFADGKRGHTSTTHGGRRCRREHDQPSRTRHDDLDAAKSRQALGGGE
jgi:hypothetical protein